MSYGYKLYALRVDNKTKKSVKVEFTFNGPFSSVKECYIDALDVVDNMGNSKNYSWLSTFCSLLYNKIDGAVRMSKFDTLETHSQLYSYMITIDAQDFYAKS